MRDEIMALATIIARQHREIEALRDTLASTAEVAANAERSASHCRQQRQAALDEAWERLDELLGRTASEEGKRWIIRSRHVVETLGGMDPAKRQADAASDGHLHSREWSKAP